LVVEIRTASNVNKEDEGAFKWGGTSWFKNESEMTDGAIGL